MRTRRGGAGVPMQAAHLEIWDSSWGRSAEAFSFFREIICERFMPWTPETSHSPFAGRVESVSLEKGAIGRIRVSPIVAVKTKQNIEDSIAECIHGNLIISGELKVEQGNHSHYAKPGDLVLYRSFVPVTLTVKPNQTFKNLAFTILRSEFSEIPNSPEKLHNRLFSRDAMIEPLKSCLTLIAEEFDSLSFAELSAVFNASISLLPLAAGCLNENECRNKRCGTKLVLIDEKPFNRL
jgi:AraC family transcriptional activator of tynA and feaB